MSAWLGLVVLRYTSDIETRKRWQSELIRSCHHVALRINERKLNTAKLFRQLKQWKDKGTAQIETLSKIKSPYLILNITGTKKRTNECTFGAL